MLASACSFLNGLKDFLCEIEKKKKKKVTPGSFSFLVLLTLDSPIPDKMKKCTNAVRPS